MDKRLPLALVLCLAFFWTYTAVIKPLLNPQPPPPPPGAAPAEGDPAATLPEPTLPVPAQREEVPPLEPGVPVPFDGLGFRAELSTAAAGLAWLHLTDYHTAPRAEDELPLVSAGLSLSLRDVGDKYGLDRVRWELVEERTAEGRRRFVFTHRTADGLLFTREYAESPLPHLFDLSISVANQGSATGGTLSLALEGPRGLVDEGPAMGRGPMALAVVQGPGAPVVETWERDELASGVPRRVGENERLVAAGVTTNYFALLLVPDAATFVGQVRPEAIVDRLKLQRAVDARQPRSAEEAESLSAALAEEHRTNASVHLLLQTAVPAPGAVVRFGFRVYAGARDDELANDPAYAFLGPVVEIAYGSMAWINRALLAVLKALHRLTTNWGVAIILLTAMVRALLFPLNRMQQVSMLKHSAAMQRLKPELDALKERYKNNKRKFAEEQMKLFGKHGIRPPLGGCLLPFLQLPIWVSLYQILNSSIDLRHAGFVAWIDDLSAADRMPFGFFGLATLNVLPILTAAAMLLQMKFTPKPADEAAAQSQKLMMWIMPVMFLWFLYSNPSGLSLYILSSSLLGVFEFQIIRRKWPVNVTPAQA